MPRIGVFVELHVEQGRALDLVDRPIAVGVGDLAARALAASTFAGEANHAGTTRLADRRDPMLAFASSVHAARAAAAERTRRSPRSGKVVVEPNGANAIPSLVRAWLDARAADERDADRSVDAISAAGQGHAALTAPAHGDRRVGVTARSIPRRSRARQRALARLGDVPCCPPRPATTPGSCPRRVPSAMLFVRNPTGVSHSPAEHAELPDCQAGVEALADVMAGVGDVTTWWCEHAWLRRRAPSRGVLITVADGRIALDRRPTRRRCRRYIGCPAWSCPGMANAHSHAFHRALRSRTQRGPRIVLDVA